MLNRIASCVLLGVLAVPCLAQETDDKVIAETLENGLHVILRHVHTAPNTTVMTLYDIGELHDPEGASGMAHLMEHLLVTCATAETEAMPAQDWFAMYNSQANAQTGLDYTVIAASVPNDEVHAELERAAARLTSLKITEADLEREKPRMFHELRNMYEGWPSLAARNLARHHIDPPPAGAQRAGRIEHVKNITTPQLRKRYDNYYRANNVTLIVVGEFDMESTAETIGQLFAPMEAGGQLPAARRQGAPDFGGTATKTVSKDVVGQGPKGVVTLAFKAPDMTSAEYAAFIVLAPRLWQQLIMKKVQQSATFQPFWYTPLDDPGAVYLSHPIESRDEVEEATRLLWECVNEAIESDPNAPLDRSMLQYQLGPMLGIMRVPDRVIALNTYGEALRLGRFHQLGLSPDTLRENVLDLFPASANEAGAKLFSKDRSFTAVVIAE